MATLTRPDYTAPGAVLPNRATVVGSAIARNGDVFVLAFDTVDYVTWWLDPTTGDTYSGHYFPHAHMLNARAFALAVEDLNTRAGRTGA